MLTPKCVVFIALFLSFSCAHSYLEKTLSNKLEVDRIARSTFDELTEGKGSREQFSRIWADRRLSFQELYRLGLPFKENYFKLIDRNMDAWSIGDSDSEGCITEEELVLKQMSLKYFAERYLFDRSDLSEAEKLALAGRTFAKANGGYLNTSSEAYAQEIAKIKLAIRSLPIGAAPEDVRTWLLRELDFCEAVADAVRDYLAKHQQAKIDDVAKFMYTLVDPKYDDSRQFEDATLMQLRGASLKEMEDEAEDDWRRKEVQRILRKRAREDAHKAREDRILREAGYGPAQ